MGSTGEGEVRLAGKIWQNGEHWLVEVPVLDVMTQGNTRADALRMIADLIATMADEEGFSVAVNSGASGVITIEASNAGPLAAVMHRRQREKHGPY